MGLRRHPRSCWGAPERLHYWSCLQEAFSRIELETVTGGANLLRHSLATNLLAKGVSLTEIADVMGQPVDDHGFQCP